MDTNQLQAFDQIVRHNSFSKAARMLDISQPTISLRIQALEQAVGGALFVRGGSRLELTELGTSFLPYARQALAVLATGVETARLATRGERGNVVVGTLPSLTGDFFSATLARLHVAHPELGLIVHTGHNQQIAEMLYDGIVKVGFLTWPFFSSDLAVILRIQEPLIVVSHTSHPLAGKGMVEIEELELADNPFLRIDWSIEVKRWQDQVMMRRRTGIEVPPQTAYDLLLRGVGVALLTHAFVAADLAAGRLVEIPVNGLPRLMRESALVRLARVEKFSTAVSEFIRIFREEARVYCIPS